jgi:signal transduction histidine kinase/CheY-like chemotaxis protein/CHASE1-domain containing sensor protein
VGLTDFAASVRRARSTLVPGLVIATLGLMLTGLGVRMTSQRVHDAKALEFTRHVDSIATDVQAQFEHPLLVIRGFMGAQVRAGDYPKRQETFRNFMRSPDIVKEFRGVQRFDYLEPVHGKFDAMDLDPEAQHIRQEAVARAIDSGKSSLSASLVPTQERPEGVGFFLVLAAYQGATSPDSPPARRAALVGVYSAMFAARDVLQSLLLRTHGIVDFELFDGLDPGASRLLLTTASEPRDSVAGGRSPDFPAAGAFQEDRRLEVGGRALLLRTRSNAAFEGDVNQSAPLLTGLIGLLCSLLVSAGAMVVQLRRNRGNFIIKKLKHDLQNQTEQLQQEHETLVANENFHAAVLDSLSEHITVIDERGIIIAVNHAWRRFGLENGGAESAVNPIGSNYLDVCQPAVPSEGAEGATEVCAGVRAVLERRCGHFEMAYPCDSPTEQRWFRVSVTLMQGALQRVVISHKNITEEHRIRAQLEEVNRHLESSLKQAQELVVSADLANLAKSQFLSTMSHEIRTPMNAILGMLKLLAGTALSAQQGDYIQKTTGAAAGLLRLINDILDFSKGEAGKLELDSHAFRCDRLWSELSDILSANVGAKPIEVLFDMDAGLPEVLQGDLLRLKQVLTNLGANALKFTDSGVVVVGAKVTQRSEAAVEVEFYVRDTGIGIAPEHQEHIFSAFTQAEASTTRRFGGTGLGLAISRQLVERMGGVLRVESAQGVGSTFSFRMHMPTVSDVAREDVQVAGPVLVNRRLLVIDDNPLACELMLSMLAARGVQADAAHSGPQALSLVQGRRDAGLEPYQAIILDWQMPGMDGWETARQLRAQSRVAADLAPPLLIMVTANGRQLLSQRTHEEQAMINGFLAKPVSASMLLDSVANARTWGAAFSLANLQASSERRLEGMRLLVVEDNLFNQQVAEELLSREGALVSLAANGKLGVAAVAAATVPFDAVLMDLQMPVLDGYGATRLIREQLGLTGLPVIALSANALPQDRVASLAAGMTEHVGKPFEISELTEVLLAHTGWVARAHACATVVDPDVAPGTAMAAAEPVSEMIDVAGALAWVGDDIALYRKFLDSFLDDVRGNADQLQTHFERGEQSDAARVLHTLKGLARTVGALDLARAAAHAEARFKHALPPEDAQILVIQIREQIASATQALLEVAKTIDATLHSIE